MTHSEQLTHKTSTFVAGKSLEERINGRFYTPDILARRLAGLFASETISSARHEINIADPFCGDGRLIVAFLEMAASLPKYRGATFSVTLWDNDPGAVEIAHKRVTCVAKKHKLRLRVNAESGDTFLRPIGDQFDLILTNPPWEALKPDRRELQHIREDARAGYLESLRAYDQKLSEVLPNSQPSRKFSGWGTNLSRCGLELSIKMLRAGGSCGIILPSSVFSDQVSAPLRQWLLQRARLKMLQAFPAEAKLFRGVDQTCVAAVFKKTPKVKFAPIIQRFDTTLKCIQKSRLELTNTELQRLGYAIPIDLNAEESKLLLGFTAFPKLDDFCSDAPDGLWLGREWDETGYKTFTSVVGTVPFVKGRSVSRYSNCETFEEFIDPKNTRPIPCSVRYSRVAWRDVSRRTQARRMIATIIPAGCVTGNSLHVGHFKDGDQSKLYALLGILNSVTFEFQLRSKLGTGHVSLGAVRGIHVPPLDDKSLVGVISPLVSKIMNGDDNAEILLEAEVAAAYGLSSIELSTILRCFDRLPEAYSRKVLAHMSQRKRASVSAKKIPSSHLLNTKAKPTIFNHYTAKLSDLDLEVALAVPPGGNWKNIPLTVPSKRLEQIRASFAAGEGSRSTYYGRLHPNRPSYTINTYFNRPGNGCHLHYDYAGGQHRVLSEREAARLQSFPDSFVFSGSHQSIHKQIGNAVPPLLAYQIARTLPCVGQYVDLFSGAGGLSLGFSWAGWKPIIANDIEAYFIESYQRNIHQTAVTGDIRHAHVFTTLVDTITQQRSKGTPLLIIGGPPCQGFSTAGKQRSLDDERNHLFKEFKRLVSTIRPDGFVFENVTGLLNMQKGAVFEMIRQELQILDNPLVPWVLKAEEFAVPQRRTRLFLMSLPKMWGKVMQPQQLTSMKAEATLFARTKQAVSVADALSDLPALKPGQDGSGLDYASDPQHAYQAFMRGKLTPQEFLDTY